MGKNIIYVKHATEEVMLPLGPDMTYTQWHRLNEIRRDPSVSVFDFNKELDK